MKKVFLLLGLLAAGSHVMAQKGGVPLLITPQPLTFINADTTLKLPTLADLTKVLKRSYLQGIQL